jgi:hypothetical protein
MKIMATLKSEVSGGCVSLHAEGCGETHHGGGSLTVCRLSVVSTHAGPDSEYSCHANECYEILRSSFQHSGEEGARHACDEVPALFETCQ